MLSEPQQVMIWFGRPIYPEPIEAMFLRGPTVVDPPLDVDELEGTLTNWQKRGDGWWGF
jgi:hypothetical protein